VSVKIRKRGSDWWVFADHQNRRKAKKVGTLSAAKK
jgi:hypothetical protein